MDDVESRLKEIDEEIDRLDAILEEKDNVWFAEHINSDTFLKDYPEYVKYNEPERSQIRLLSREQRMIQPIELSELSNFGTVMSLEEFIDNVKGGGFINYDGFGIYVKDGQETGIEIYPSDVKNLCIREGFDTIIWFNR